MLLINHPGRSSSFYFQWILVFALLLGGIEMQVRHLRTYHFTSGLAYKLQCNSQIQNVSVTWSYNVNQKLENISGIRIKENALWFLPAEPFHRENYTCLSRKGNESWVTVFSISVDNESCPRINRENTAMGTDKLECVLEHIFHLDPQAHVTWLKNCSPLNAVNSKILLMNRSAENEGLYTCFVNFTFEGQNYSAAQTTKIYNLDKVLTQPKVIFPKQEKLRVILGNSYDLKCKAQIGTNGRDETFMYWMRDSTSIVEHTSDHIVEEDNIEYMLSTLHITAEQLHTNYSCIIEHPAGIDFGTVTLIPANQNERYLWIALGLVSLLILAAVGFYLFKVDLVLVFRDLCSPVAVHCDGKSYDAYVSYLHGDQLSLSSMTFALHSLPAVLEERYGYKLFISGRDELPGEAVHDTIADRINQSRRLIIVLTSQSFECQSSASQKHTEPLLIHSDPTAQTWGTYEQRVGLYDALVKQGLKVILVQMEDGVERSSLPESLQYISRTKGILRWSQNSNGTNRKFWKHLRYQMPPAQRRKSSQCTELQEV